MNDKFLKVAQYLTSLGVDLQGLCEKYTTKFKGDKDKVCCLTLYDVVTQKNDTYVLEVLQTTDGEIYHTIRM